jgi:predicted ATPase/DNA-binding SARP family transcriptional activator
MAQLEMRFLGPARVSHGAEDVAFKTRKALALLVYLVLEGGMRSRDELVALLWPDANQEDGRASLRNTLALLRRSLEKTVGNALVIVEHDRIGFDLITPHALDLEVLEVAFKHAPKATADNLEPLEYALELYRGELLEGFMLSDAPEFEGWLEMRRESARRRVAVVLERLSSLQADTGRGPAALETTERWLKLEPSSDAACRRAMELHLVLEQPKAALESFEAFRARLQREIGASPERQTLALAERIRADHAQPRAHHSSRRGHALEAPMVGRTLEHTRLVEAFQTVRSGRTETVLIEGEAGIGKTRLAHEFIDWARAQGAFVLRGRSFETGGRLPYQPVLEILRGWLEHEANPLEVLPEVWLGELSALLPELRERFPDLPVPTVDESIGRTRLFESVARLVLALCARGPLVVFVDDLQWTDTASLDVLHYLIHRASETNASLLVLFTARSEALPGTPGLTDWLEQLVHDASLERFELRALNEGATSEWLKSLGANDHGLEAFSRWLFAETQGQPLFINQTLKNLHEHGVLRSHANAGFDFSSIAHDNAKPIGLAPGVREVIRARITRLSPSAFALLSAGAVLGQDLEFGVMCQVAGLPESDGLTALDELLNARLLLEAKRYSFAHDKIRDVTYTEAGDARRKVFHRRALETLEAAKAPAAVLASHAVAAGQTEQIVRYSLKAGFEAFELRALPEAITHLETVRGMIQKPISGLDPQVTLNDLERFRLYRTLRHCYKATGLFQPELEQQVLEQMYEFELETYNEGVKFEIHYLREMIYYYQSGGRGTHRAMLETKLEQARSQKDVRGELDVLFAMYECEWHSDQHITAKLINLEAVMVARRLGSRNVIGQAISHVASENNLLDLWDEAEVDYKEAIEFVSQHDSFFTTRIHVYYALNLLCLGRANEAVAMWRECINLSQHMYFARHLMTRMWLSSGLLEIGDYGQALEVATEYNRESQPVHTSNLGQDAKYSHFTWVLLQLGQLHVAEKLLNEAKKGKKGWNQEKVPHIEEYFCALSALQGNWRAAGEHALEAAKRREMMPHDKFRRPIFRPTWLETEALLRGGHDDLARQEVQRLKELARHYKRMQIPYFRALAVLEAWDKNLELAIKNLEEALSLALEIGLPSEVWQIDAKLAELLEKHGDLENAAKARDTALEIVNSLAATIPDGATRTTFLEFARAQVVSRAERLST